MKWKHLLFAGAPVFVLQFAINAPAQALTAPLLALPVASVAGLTWQEPAISASPCANTPGGAFAADAPSKSSAILGGAPSRLEQISLQQASATTVTKVEPAAGGFRCPQQGRTWTSPAVIVAPGLQPNANPDDFLGTARLPLRKTTFDAQWNRVRHAGLSARVVSDVAGPGKPTMATLAAINAWSNTRIHYTEDRDLYGKSDYWATASATLHRGAGDCEDIAIVKMQALAALGVPSSDMYLTVARDTVRNADHALLVVKLDGRYWLLDNATNDLLDASMSHDYRPIMSFSSSGKWLHGYARDVQERPAPQLVAMR